MKKKTHRISLCMIMINEEEYFIPKSRIVGKIGNEDTVKKYHYAAQEYPDYFLPWFWLGYYYLRIGNREASRWFNEALRRNLPSLRSHWLKAKVLENSELMAELLETHGAHAKAVHWYDEALRSNPFFSSAALGMGRIYYIQGEMEQAGRAFATAADLAPAWAEASI